MPSYRTIGGTLILFGVTQFLFSLHVAEELYPGYSTSQNSMSDLGATCGSRGCYRFEPSSILFNSSVLILGLTLVAASYYIYCVERGGIFSAFLGFAGVGAMGVGLFPETIASLHKLFALITFLFGGLSAIAAIQVVRSNLRYFSVLMGVTTLLTLVLYSSGIYLGLGLGGIERMIAFPTLFWGLVFASYLISQGQTSIAHAAST